MRTTWAFAVVLLPLLCNAVIINTDPIYVNNATLIKQVHFMFDNVTTPAKIDDSSVENYIDVTFKVKKNDPNLPAKGVVEVMVVKDEIFDLIGIEEGNVHYYCCDDQAYDNGNCTNHNRLWVRSNKVKLYSTNSVEFNNEEREVSTRLDITEGGKYWMVVGLCDPDTQNIVLTGTTTVMNPYGHIPARMYGIIPFTRLIMVAYTILMIYWIVRCCWYRNELISVHIMITVVLAIFLFDVILRLASLLYYNTEGEYNRMLTMFSLVTTSATHAVARCLTVMVAMGLGVSKVSLSGSLFKIILMGVVYFGFSLWDAISTTFGTNHQMNLYRIIPASILDSMIYFWILQSLLDTIQELEDKKQKLKLGVFLSLRNMIIVAVVVSTAYNIVFSYLIMKNLIESLWKYQWFFNDGVWTAFYFVVIVVIMHLWAPNEHSRRYADHIEIDNDEKQDTEEYAMRDQETLASNGEGTVKVATVEATEESLKPMSINQSA